MSDKRFHRTEKALKKAITELLREKRLNEISVVELCRRADMNKSTFYLHYKDIYDYYNYLNNTVSEKLCSLYGEYSYSEVLENFSDIFLKSLTIIRDDELMGVLLMKDHGDTLITKITNDITHAVLSKKAPEDTDSLSTEITCRFITFGTLGVIHEYSEQIFNNPELSETLAKQIQSGFMRIK